MRGAGARGRGGAGAARAGAGAAPSGTPERAATAGVPVPRRATAGALASALAGAALAQGGAAGPARAAYGEAANIFGKSTNTSGYVPYEGDGFRMNLPAKWGPSAEREFDGTVLRYVDNGVQANNLTVTATPTDKRSVRDIAGSPEEFLQGRAFLFGDTTGSYETRSEGGFAENSVQEVSLLESFEKEGAGGRPIYMFEVLARTNDGDEGGRHHLVAAVVSGGKLLTLKVTAGEKRWFRGAKKACLGTWESFEPV